MTRRKDIPELQYDWSWWSGWLAHRTQSPHLLANTDMLGNHVCSELSCGKDIYVFGFNRTGSKTYVCQAHMSVLIDKKMNCLPVAADHFVETLEDTSEYERRSKVKEKGYGVITMLERKCERDCEKAQERLRKVQASVLQAVQASFAELECQLSQRLASVKRELEEWRRSLDLFTWEKSCQLSSSVENLCTDEAELSLFRLVLEDCALPVAKAVVTSAHLLPAQWPPLGVLTHRQEILQELQGFASKQAAKKAGVARKALKYAASLGGTAPSQDLVSSALQQKHRAWNKLLTLLPSQLTVQDAERVAEFCFHLGVRARQCGDYEKALDYLERSLALQQTVNLEVFLQLGEVRAHFASRQAEACALLNEAMIRDSGTELGVRLSNALAETYHQRGCWEQAMKVCEWLLDQAGTTPYTSELLRARFLLADSRCLQASKSADMAKTLSPEGSLTQWLWQFVSAERNAELGTLQAELEEHSYTAACVARWRALIYQVRGELSPAEKFYKQACHIYQVHFPEALDFALCRYSLGVLYERLKSPTKAMVEYEAANQLYSANYSQTINHARCLAHLGHLSFQTKNLTRAEEQFREACKIYAREEPKAANYDFCLSSLGGLYMESGNKEKAALEYKEALTVAIVRKDQQREEKYRAILRNLGSH